jgi:phytol kinase
VWTAIWFGAAGMGFVGFLTLAELAARRWSLRPEWGRKLAHVSCGVLAAALPLVLPFPAITGLAAAFVPVMAISRRVGLWPIVHSAERATYGEVYFPIGILLAAALVPHRVEYSFGVLVLAVADALAAVAGQRFGRRAYRLLATSKTYVGSACFFSVVVALGAVVMQLGPGLSVQRIIAVLGVAAVVTLEEAAMGGGADNVVLPVSAAAALRTLVR